MILILFLIFTLFKCNIVFAENTGLERNINNVQKYEDSDYEYDADDLNDSEYISYDEYIDSEIGFNSRSISPNRENVETADLEYEIYSLPKTWVIQKSYITSTYVYTVQVNPSNNVDVWISRCRITGTTAIYQDHMILQNCGHNQGFELYNYGGNTYFWVLCKPCEYHKYKTPTQLGRVRYVAGSVISNYTQITRFSNLNCANRTATSFGSVYRVDAALSSDNSKVLLAVRSYEFIGDLNSTSDVNNIEKYRSKDLQYSYYDSETLNEALDDIEEDTTTNHVSFKNNITLKNACEFSCVQQRGNLMLPQGSCQGVEFTNAQSIYIAGNRSVSGADSGSSIGTDPQIAKLTKSNNTYIYSSCVDIVGIPFRAEIEGLQIRNSKLYFIITKYPDLDGDGRPIHSVYSIPKSSF